MCKMSLAQLLHGVDATKSHTIANKVSPAVPYPSHHIHASVGQCHVVKTIPDGSLSNSGHLHPQQSSTMQSVDEENYGNVSNSEEKKSSSDIVINTLHSPPPSQLYKSSISPDIKYVPLDGGKKISSKIRPISSSPSLLNKRKITNFDFTELYHKPTDQDALLASRLRKRRKRLQERQQKLQAATLCFQEEHKKNSRKFDFQCRKTKSKRKWGMDSLVVGVSTTQGTRQYMEDRYMAIPSLYEKSGLVSPYFFAIYDGHSGSIAAQMATDSLHTILANNINMRRLAERNDGSDLSLDDTRLVVNALNSSFADMESKILEATYPVGKRDGSTALVCLVQGTHLFVANIGDTRAIISREDGSVERLSVDHKPNLHKEKRRIEAAGGKVIKSGCWRVAHANIPYRLAISRAFGDCALKTNLPEDCTGPLVSAIPYINCIRLNTRDRFMILASDGVWDVISDSEAVDIVQSQISQLKNSSEIMKLASDKLVEEALRKGSCDNITAMVVFFGWS